MGVRLSTVKFFDCTKEVYLRIEGNWLAEIGFKPDSKFIIDIEEKGKITLKIVDEEI